MQKSLLLAALLVATITAGTVAEAQDPWNRQVESISALPDGSGGAEFYAYFHCSTDPSSAPTDLSTEVEWYQNGVFVGSTIHTAIAQFAGDCTPPAGGSCAAAVGCGVWDVGSELVDGFCRALPGGCKCGIYRGASCPVPVVTSGDEIMVLLRPAPGALPDTDESDDLMILSYSGPVVPPNRSIQSVEVVPDATGGSVLNVAWRAEAGQVSHTTDLSTIIEVHSNGALIATAGPFRAEGGGPMAVCNPQNCGFADCGIWVIDDIGTTIFGECLPSELNPSQCVCALTKVTPIPLPTPTPPIVELGIILRPVPGALPELPGFPEDDDEHFPGLPFIRGDCNVNGGVNLADAITLLQELFNNGAAALCDDACDVNDDGSKGLGDAIYLLVNLFNGGASPPAPYPDCGVDPTGDLLDCGASPFCSPI